MAAGRWLQLATPVVVILALLAIYHRAEKTKHNVYAMTLFVLP